MTTAYAFETMTAETTPGGAPAPRPADELRERTAAARVSFTWFGVAKALTEEQRTRAAQPFDADAESISAGKKLVNTKHPAYREVTRTRTAILDYWKGHSLPFPEPGMRLIRRDRIADFQAQMESFSADLDDAVAKLDEHYHELQTEAQTRLGALYNPADYPATLRGAFKVTWDFPSVEPPSYLMQLRPELYEQERQRMAARFEEAVGLAEQAFIIEFQQTISHLCERLARGEDGAPKVFRDSAIGNLTDFFEKFRSLNVRSNAQLDALVEQAREAVRGASPSALRGNGTLREAVASSLADVERQITDLMTDAPRRRIIRTRPTEQPAPNQNGAEPCAS